MAGDAAGAAFGDAAAGSGFVFQVSGFGFRVSGFGFRVSGFRSRVSGLGFRVSCFGFRDPGSGFRISDFSGSNLLENPSERSRKPPERHLNKYQVLATRPICTGKARSCPRLYEEVGFLGTRPLLKGKG